MADDLGFTNGGRPLRRRTRTGSIRVLPPQAVPLSEEDREQAVAALTALIDLWWQGDHHRDRDQ